MFPKLGGKCSKWNIEILIKAKEESYLYPRERKKENKENIAENALFQLVHVQ